MNKRQPHWWERPTGRPAIGVLVDYIGDHLPEAFLKDRRDDYLGYDMSKAAMAPKLPAYVQQMTAFGQWLDGILAQQKGYLTGDRLSAADLAGYHVLWLLRANCGADAIDARLGLSKRITAWMDAIAAIGHGQVTPMTPEEAVAAARAAQPADGFAADADPSGLRKGAAVVVTPEDNAKVPVDGIPVAADAQEIVIERRSDATGRLH
ncbi:glutathione S-transferase family protein, partial [Nostoc sp. NIES-2111]